MSQIYGRKNVEKVLENQKNVDMAKSEEKNTENIPPN